MFTIHMHLFNLSYSRGNPHIMWQQRDHGGPRAHMMWAGRTVLLCIASFTQIWSDSENLKLNYIGHSTAGPVPDVRAHISSYIPSFLRYDKISKNKYAYIFVNIYHTKNQNVTKTTTNCRLEGVKSRLVSHMYINLVQRIYL